MDVKQQINEELNKFQTIRNQCKKILSQRGQLEIQLNENKLVKEELDLLEDGAKTFKLIGPALIKIELKEAQDNVNNRIKYITEELKRYDQTLETLTKQQDKHREAVMKLEQATQQAMSAAVASNPK
ncbi:Prefoldin subunit 6 [Dermatophagoides pteronyssinus]|uniref:Prefoldin subunit 6 n=2 Tax=Dermatophagoides pteronyssinus TaxID=6956 RepID=A0ABQ8IZ60_DERPT|nr:prefoldin subunit 6-like [Dermatophagoides pteronyssinus]KAH9415599.1 Prefoldin subunit 6 [Dermatophagoides pteronyssinus]